MSNIKTHSNQYQNLDVYNGKKCDKSIYLNFPNTVYSPWSVEVENFSLSAAIRRPFSPGYYDPNYKPPFVPGVS
jgi:hypothetical protein